jgi:hypothetical protein
LPGPDSTVLSVSRLLLRILRILNLATGALLVAAFFASFVFEPAFREFFARQPARIDPGLLLPILRLWMVIALPAIATVHVSLSRLLEMVGTVRAGDPFVPANARRMKTIAWCTLGLQLFDLACGAMVAAMNAAGSRMDWSFSATGWLAVVLLFVLARVFEEGARLRADLEAMV